MAAISIVQSGEVHNDAGTTFPTATHSAWTAGNAVIVFVRSQGQVINGMHDGTNTFTEIGSSVTQNPHMAAWFCANVVATAGNFVIGHTTTESYDWVWWAELAGCPTSSAVAGSDFTAGSAATDLVSGSIGISASGAFFCAVSQNNFATYTAGTSPATYTLDLGNIGTGPYGGIQHRLATGTESAAVQHMTSNTSLVYTLATVAILDTTGATGGGGLPIPVVMNQYRQRRNYMKHPSGLWTPDRHIVIAKRAA